MLLKEAKMHIETESTHITPAEGNVFADLGFEPAKAKALLIESNRVTSNIFSVREALVTELVEWIKSNNLQPADAAEIFGVTRPRISDLLNKKITKFTTEALMRMLSRTGKNIQVSVR